MHSRRKCLWYLCIKSPQSCFTNLTTMLYRKDFYLWLAILPLWAFGRTVSRYSPPLWSRGFHCELIAALVLLIILHHNLWPCGSVLAKAMFTWTKGIRLLSNKLCVRGGGGRRGRGRGDFWGWVLRRAECLYFNYRKRLGGWGAWWQALMDVMHWDDEFANKRGLVEILVQLRAQFLRLTIPPVHMLMIFL